MDLDCPTLTELVVRDCDFSDATVLQSLGDTAIAPLLNSAVLEEARRSAPQAARAALPSSSTFGATFLHAAGPMADQQLHHWMAPAMDDDDFGMEIPGEGEQQPGGDDDDDDDDAGGPGGAGGVGGIRARRSVIPSRMTAHQRRIDSIPEWPDRSWQGPDRLPPELVRFGAVVSQPGNIGASSSGAATGSQTATGSAGASSSATPAAATAGAGPSRLAAGPSAAGPSSGAAAAGSSGAGSSRAAPAAAAAGAGPSSAAAGGQRARGNSMSEALDMGMTWLRSSSRGVLQDRCFVWGSSGDRLQVVASSSQQERSAAAAAAGGEPDAPAQDPAAAAAGDMPEPARRRDDADLEFASRRKSQRLQENGARLTRALSDGSGPSRSPPQQPAHTRQHHQQQQRRRQRSGSSLASSLSARQHHARWRMAPDSFGSQSSLSAAAEADDADWFEDVPSSMTSPSVSGSGFFSSQQQELDRPRRPGLNPSSQRRVGRGSGGGGGGGGDSSDSDGEAGDQGPHAPRQQHRSRIPSGKGGVPRLRVLHVEGCDRLQELQLSHLALQEVVVNGCNSLVVVALHAPQLSELELQELGDLKGACLQQVRCQCHVRSV